MKEAQLYQLDMTEDELAILAAMHLMTRAALQGKGPDPIAVLTIGIAIPTYESFVIKLDKLTQAGIVSLKAQNEAQASA
jgi:hypothetical protein